MTPEELKLRAQSIGSSEIGAVVGLSKYRSAFDVWASKQEPFLPQKENPHTLRGKVVEPGLIRWVASEVGEVTILEQARYRVAQAGFVASATPDAIFILEDGSQQACEAKAVNSYGEDSWGEPLTDEIAEEYLPQVTWQMGLSKTKLCHVGACLDQRGPVRYIVNFNPRFFGMLLERAERFWVDHVMTGKAPEPTGTDAAKEWLRARWPRHEKPMLISTVEADELVSMLRRARTEKVKHADAERSIRQRLELIIGDHEGIEGEWGKILFRANKDGVKTNWQAVCDELRVPADVLAKHTYVTKGPRVFRTPRGWGKEDDD